MDAGNIDDVAAVAGVMTSTLPGTSAFSASTWKTTGWPILTWPMFVSSMLAFTHNCVGSTIVTIGCDTGERYLSNPVFAEQEAQVVEPALA